MPDEARRERGKKRICLMGTARALLPEGTPPGREEMGVSREAKAMELLALLVLGREFLPPEGVREGKEVRRDWLAAQMYPDLFADAATRQEAREKVRHQRDKLHAALQIRPPQGANTRERNVVSVTWAGVRVDALALREGARQIHSPDTQQEMLALGDKPLLAGMTWPWLQDPAFQQVRAELDSCFLQALARRADGLLLQMEKANEAGRSAEADTCRSQALPLLDKATERMEGYGNALGRYALLMPFEAQFAELRRRAAYLPLALAAPPSPRLPQSMTRFFGRESEMQDIRGRLASGRLVTLTGMGGCGKTRLAIEVAALLEAEGRDVRLVELAALSDPALLPKRVAGALGVAEQNGVSITDTLIAFLQNRPTLILLDNCEHLLQEGAASIVPTSVAASDRPADCAEFAAHLLHACPALSLLATSRVPLNVDGEHLCRVPPLPCPAPGFSPADAPDPVAALLRYDSVRLFADRALLFRAFALGPDNAGPVAAICAALDGIPLALELAAARVKALTPEQIAAMLSDRFGLLTGGRRESPARHKTLRAVIDWSYDLLTAPEQSLFCRLSVFAGGWTLNAAEAVSSSDDTPRAAVLDLLESLVDKSLVNADLTASPGRYQMLETVRQYGRDRLKERGEWASAHRKHREFYIRLAEEADQKLKGPDQKQWLYRLEAEHDNLLAALNSFCVSKEDNEGWVQLAGHLWWFWWVRGYLNEGRRQLSEALSQGQDASAKARARVLEGIGNLAQHQGDYEAARASLEKGLGLLREINDDRRAASILGSLGNLVYNQGNYCQAGTYHQESLNLFTTLEDKRGIAICNVNLGNVAYEQEDLKQARQLFNESLKLFQEQQDERHIALVLYSLASIEIKVADYLAATSLLHKSISMSRVWGDQWSVAYLLEAFASLALAQGLACQAGVLLGAAEALREFLKSPITSSGRAPYDKAVAKVREALGEEAFAAAWAEGQRMTWEQAVAFALEEDAG